MWSFLSYLVLSFIFLQHETSLGQSLWKSFWGGFGKRLSKAVETRKAKDVGMAWRMYVSEMTSNAGWYKAR